MISRLIPRAEPTSASTIPTSQGTSTTFIGLLFKLTGVPAAIAIIIFISILGILLILLLIVVGVKTCRRYQEAKKPRHRFGVAVDIDSDLNFGVLREAMASMDGANVKGVDSQEERSYDLEKNAGDYGGMLENMHLVEDRLYSGFADMGLDPRMQQSYLTRHSTRAQIPPPSSREGSLGRSATRLQKKGSPMDSSTLPGVAQSRAAPGARPQNPQFEMLLVPVRSYDRRAGRDDGNRVSHEILLRFNTK